MLPHVLTQWKQRDSMTIMSPPPASSKAVCLPVSPCTTSPVRLTPSCQEADRTEPRFSVLSPTGRLVSLARLDASCYLFFAFQKDSGQTGKAGPSPRGSPCCKLLTFWRRGPWFDHEPSAVAVVLGESDWIAWKQEFGSVWVRKVVITWAPPSSICVSKEETQPFSPSPHSLLSPLTAVIADIWSFLLNPMPAVCPDTRSAGPLIFTQWHLLL